MPVLAEYFAFFSDEKKVAVPETNLEDDLMRVFGGPKNVR